MNHARTHRRFAFAAAILVMLLASPLVSGVLAQVPPRRPLTHGAPHPETIDPTRFTTTRASEVVLPLPEEQDAFFFVVFGDRTGGPAEGVKVLAQAVEDTNLLEPDLVMTVGDLIEGYNQTDEWMAQMREYKGIMDGLLMPWFPVAGNHDIYWRGPDRPEGEHEAHYEMHFGPLWYAFEHKDCWFIALYSDEGNPATGEKSISRSDTQRMSDEQLDWLRSVLGQARDAQHVFVFLHHPRWIGGNYGDDWDKVHEVLVEAGNVTACFAGHIHRMRSDPRDGIEYVTLATVGGGQSELAPSAGFLHQFHVVTVRPSQIALAAIPVGEVMDVRAITGQVSNETARLARQRPEVETPLAVRSDGSVEGVLRATLANPTSAPIDVTVMLDSADSRWGFRPDHHHGRIEAGGTAAFEFRTDRTGRSIDRAFRPLEVVVDQEYLAGGHRFPIPTARAEVPLRVELEAPAIASLEQALAVDGRDDVVRVPSSMLPLPDGPLTLECWFRAKSYGERTGLVCKTESSDYGLFVSQGRPGFYLFLGDSYAEAFADEAILETGVWHHLAGVYDGSAVRLYLDGEQVASVARSGARRTNDLPFLIGADVNGRGEPVSHFHGLVDAVHLSSTARYTGERVRPVRRPSADAHTVLLLNMDGFIGPWLYDESGADRHPTAIGGPMVVPVR